MLDHYATRRINEATADFYRTATMLLTSQKRMKRIEKMKTMTRQDKLTAINTLTALRSLKLANWDLIHKIEKTLLDLVTSLNEGEPKEPVKAHEKRHCLTFQEAYEWLQAGVKVSRLAWKGKRFLQMSTD